MSRSRYEEEPTYDTRDTRSRYSPTRRYVSPSRYSPTNRYASPSRYTSTERLPSLPSSEVTRNSRYSPTRRSPTRYVDRKEDNFVDQLSDATTRTTNTIGEYLRNIFNAVSRAISPPRNTSVVQTSSFNDVPRRY